MGSDIGRRMKGWQGWVLLAFVAVGLLAVGATRDGGPRTPDERIAAIAQRIACPVCDGESVYESRHPTSVNIKDAIEERVEEGRLTDDEIIESIVSAREGEELLVPTADGIEALAWALPATAFVFGVVGLTIAFRRWRESARAVGHATDDDYALVAEAMAAVDRPPDASPEVPDAGGDEP